MSEAQAFIEWCPSVGVRVCAEGGKLKIDAPRGMMTPELVAMFRRQRADLLRALEVVELPTISRPLPGAGGVHDPRAGRVGGEV